MSLRAPTVSGVSPTVNDTDVVLRPTIEIKVGGPAFVDPLTWGSQTFALYGPGDVVLESGPGTILNSGLEDSAFPLLDGPLRRDRVPGTFSISISGANGTASGLDTSYVSGLMGQDGYYVLCQFSPTAPLLSNTEYQAVLVGDDSTGLIIEGVRRFEGLTSWTSPSGFVQTSSGINTGATSGFVHVVNPYSKTLETSLYDSSTGYNDTYTITITSGHNVNAVQGTAISGFKYQWVQASTAGTNAEIVSGTTDVHNLGNGLTVNFRGTFASGEIHQLDVYIPRPLAVTQIWKFSTGEISQFGTPPVEPQPISVVIDETADGGFGVSTSETVSGTRFYVINSEPAHLEYDVATSTSFIRLQFNKVLSSGIYAVGNVDVSSTPLLGLPARAAASTITPSRLETSGAFLKIYLP